MLGDGEEEAGAGLGDDVSLLESGRDVEICLDGVNTGVDVTLVNILKEVTTVLAEGEAGPGVELGLVEIGRGLEAGLDAEGEAGPGAELGLVEIGRGVEAGLDAEGEAGPGVELGLVEIGREVEAGLDAEGEAGPGVELGLVEIGREVEAGLDAEGEAGVAELVEEAGVMAEDVGAAQTAWQGGNVAGYVSTHITLPALPALVYTVPQAEPVKPTLQEQFPLLVHTLNTNTNY
eukprot:Em0021g177a